MEYAQNGYLKEKFVKISIGEETLSAKIFEECGFEGCSFIGTKIEKSAFINCTFENSILSAVAPHECRFLDVKFSGCKVIGIDWTKSLKIRDLSFTDCQVNYSNFRFLEIPDLKMIRCEARESDFTEAELIKADFRKSNFENARFFKTDLTEADFRGAVNYRIDIKNNKILKAHFSLPEVMALLDGLDINIEK
jgi:fluoroquinolone resistance protein